MKSEKLTKRSIQAINTKKKIHEVSIELIRKYGFDGVTVENICSKADVSVGAFYHYFDSKAAVINEIFSEIDEHFKKRVYPKLKGTAIEKITSFFGSYAAYVTKQGIDFAIQVFSNKNKLFLNHGRFLWTSLKGLIAEGQQNHELTSSIESDEIMNTLFILVRGVVFDWCLHDGSYDLKAEMEKLVGQILLSYKA